MSDSYQWPKGQKLKIKKDGVLNYMAKIETFTANLTKEGSTGSVRGKVPATLISAMGGGDGDVIEFQLNGKTLVGGRIITGKEARSLRSQGRQNFGSAAPVAKKTAVAAPKAKANGRAVAKPVVAAPKAKAKAKVAPVAVKPSKNKTSVAVGKATAKGQGKKVSPRFSL